MLFQRVQNCFTEGKSALKGQIDRLNASHEDELLKVDDSVLSHVHQDTP